MTLLLDLPPEMETAIRQDADRQGTTPEALALDGLRRLYPQVHTGLKTGADVIAQWEAEGAFLPAEQREDHQRRARQVRAEAWRRE